LNCAIYWNTSLYFYPGETPKNGTVDQVAGWQMVLIFKFPAALS